MAKGRKLTVSRSERLLGSYGYGYGGAQGLSSGDPDLGEDDVWSIVDDDAAAMADHAPPIYADDLSGRHHGREERQVGGLSLAFDADDAGKTASSRIVHQFRKNDGGAASSPRSGHQIAASAPVNVPDWSKILRVVSVESFHEFDGCADCIGGDDESPEEIVPPHEYLARVSAHSRNSAANSVFEGVGRTLKGLDLSRVRDAVWRQTGFDG